MARFVDEQASLAQQTIDAPLTYPQIFIGFYHQVYWYYWAIVVFLFWKIELAICLSNFRTTVSSKNSAFEKIFVIPYYCKNSTDLNNLLGSEVLVNEKQYLFLLVNVQIRCDDKKQLYFLYVVFLVITSLNVCNQRGWLDEVKSPHHNAPSRITTTTLDITLRQAFTSFLDSCLNEVCHRPVILHLLDFHNCGTMSPSRPFTTYPLLHLVIFLPRGQTETVMRPAPPPPSPSPFFAIWRFALSKREP